MVTSMGSFFNFFELLFFLLFQVVDLNWGGTVVPCALVGAGPGQNCNSVSHLGVGWPRTACRIRGSELRLNRAVAAAQAAEAGA